jgi:hypothetical protein
MGNSHHRGPFWGTLRGFIYWDFFERQMKEGSGNGTSLFNLIWAPLFGPRLCYKPESGGQSGTSVKDQGSHDLASEYGAQRACFKA